MRKISVIIPTYNSQETIERAILSILKQKGINELFEIELLICDDCSTDNTIEKCHGWLANIQVFKNTKNSGGPNWGRNKGIKEATGELVAFLDHDDEWVEDKLITQLKEIDNGYEFIYSLCIKGV